MRRHEFTGNQFVDAFKRRRASQDANLQEYEASKGIELEEVCHHLCLGPLLKWHCQMGLKIDGVLKSDTK